MGNDLKQPLKQHDHKQNHEHDHGHDHGQDDDHGHDHEHEHDHGQDDDHGHGHDHEHGHSHNFTDTPAKKLTIALILTLSFLGVEIVVGWLANSLALLSDAGHMLTDAGALALALMAQRLSARPRSTRTTYGLRRAEILAALLNGLVLGASSIWIVYEAILRWSQPLEVKGGWVMLVATLGLLINLIAAWVLSRGEKNTNVKAALAHVLADAAGSVAAMIAGGLVYEFGWIRADAVVSLLISVLILWGAWRLLKDSLQILLEAAPTDTDCAAIEQTIRETPGVSGFHDLHIWSISDGFPVLTVHVQIEPDAHGVEIARRVSDRIRQLHRIEHATVQPEAAAIPLVPTTTLLKKMIQEPRPRS